MENNIEIVSMLLHKGADPNSFQTDKNGRIYYPLDIAIKNKFDDAITMLVLFGANPKLSKMIKKNSITHKSFSELKLSKGKVVPTEFDEKIDYYIVEYPKLKGDIIKCIQKVENIDDFTLVSPLDVKFIERVASQVMEGATGLIKIIEDLIIQRHPLLEDQYKIWQQIKEGPAKESSGYIFNSGRPISDEVNAKWRENRNKLHSFAVSLHKYLTLAAEMYSDFNSFREEVGRAIANTARIASAKSQLMKKMCGQQKRLRRIGLDDDLIDDIEDLSKQRVERLENATAQINAFQQSFGTILSDLTACLQLSAR